MLSVGKLPLIERPVYFSSQLNSCGRGGELRRETRRNSSSHPGRNPVLHMDAAIHSHHILCRTMRIWQESCSNLYYWCCVLATFFHLKYLLWSLHFASNRYTIHSIPVISAAICCLISAKNCVNMALGRIYLPYTCLKIAFDQ